MLGRLDFKFKEEERQAQPAVELIFLDAIGKQRNTISSWDTIFVVFPLCPFCLLHKHMHVCTYKVAS